MAEKLPKTKSEGIDPKEILEKATDIKAAMFCIKHIDNPCEVEVGPREKRNIRDFYIKLAKDLLEKMTNPHARKLLEDKIHEYKQ